MKVFYDILLKYIVNVRRLCSRRHSGEGLSRALGGTMALVATTNVAARPRVASSRDGIGRRGHRSLRAHRGAARRGERMRVVALAGHRGNRVPASTRPRGSGARSSSSVSIGRGTAGRVASVGPVRAYQGAPPASGGDGPATGGDPSATHRRHPATGWRHTRQIYDDYQETGRMGGLSTGTKNM